MNVTIKIDKKIYEAVINRLAEEAWFYAGEPNDYGFAYLQDGEWVKPCRKHGNDSHYESRLSASRQADAIRWLRCSGTEAVFNKKNMTASFTGSRNSICELLTWFTSIDFTKCEVINLNSTRKDIPWFTPISTGIYHEEEGAFYLLLRRCADSTYEVELCSSTGENLWNTKYDSKSEASIGFKNIRQITSDALQAVSTCIWAHQSNNCLPETVRRCNETYALATFAIEGLSVCDSDIATALSDYMDKVLG